PRRRPSDRPRAPAAVRRRRDRLGQRRSAVGCYRFRPRARGALRAPCSEECATLPRAELRERADGGAEIRPPRGETLEARACRRIHAPARVEYGEIVLHVWIVRVCALGGGEMCCRRREVAGLEVEKREVDERERKRRIERCGV